jgi:hypothetical protein
MKLYPQRYSELNPTPPAGMPRGLKPGRSVSQNLVGLEHAAAGAAFPDWHLEVGEAPRATALVAQAVRRLVEPAVRSAAAEPDHQEGLARTASAVTAPVTRWLGGVGRWAQAVDVDDVARVGHAK